MRFSALALTTLVATTSAEIYFRENFNDAEWEDRWVKSVWKPSEQIGEWEHSPGKWFADIDDKGIRTSEDARFYGISAKMLKEFDNENKDLVLQFLVKHEQQIDCGGAYIKLLPNDLEQSNFGGDSDYSIMFGPDICGSTKRTHAILNYARPKGETAAKNLESKDEIRCETDENAHLYTIVIKKDNTYDVKIDGESVKNGKLEDNWPFYPPKKIQDPAQSKPKDWVDDAKMEDPEDKKPEGWDDIPKQIPDSEAQQPEDWDDEEDGEWEVPMVDNPEYKGKWSPKLIDNPEYKGEWEHPMIDNPDNFEDDKLHARCKKCGYIGFELWQVKSGTLFDDILVTDSIEEAEAEAEIVMEKINKLKEVKKEKDELEAKKREETEKANAEEPKNILEKEEEDDIDEDESDDKSKLEKDEL